MIRITAIKETKRGRYALFGEDGFLFSVDEETFVQQDLHVDAELTEMELEQLRGQSDTRKAKDGALRYLSIRAHGEQELYRKLLQRYDEHSAAAAMATMKEVGLLDDESFAHDKANALAAKGKSPFDIRQRLIAVGIDAELAEEAVRALALDGVQMAYAVLQKNYMDKLHRGERQKVMAALARRGFSHREAAEALQMAKTEMEEQTGAFE